MKITINLTKKEANHFNECWDDMDTCLIFQSILKKVERQIKVNNDKSSTK